MVSSLLVDALADPCAVLESLYDDFKKGENDAASDFPSLVAKHFANVFKFESNDALNQIDPLTRLTVAKHSNTPALVHFRTMVQDTSPSPEVYLASHRGRPCGWGLDASGLVDDAGDHERGGMFEGGENLAERTVIWAVSIPGESEWSAKRAGGGNANYEGDVASDLGAGLGKVSLNEASSSSHKLPVPSEGHVALRVKLYESVAESLKPTNMVSFIGILVHEDDETEDYAPSSNSRANTAPVLHSLFFRPIVDGITGTQSVYPQASFSDSLRAELIAWIASEGLGGDLEAAEWVLLACLSNVQSRNPPLLPLSLTLSAIPRPSNSSFTSTTPTLSHILSLLLPLFLHVPLSLDYLNRNSFEPESKEEDLHAGVLQLPPKSVILVTDAGMKEGKLEQRGLQNVQALQDVVTRQILRYNFPYSDFDLPTDMNVIVMTEGKRCTFCTTTVSIPLVRQASNTYDLYKPRESIALPANDRLDAFRDYITSARSGRVYIREEISKFIQESFVKERQNSSKIGPDDLVRRIAVAKLVALSRHQETLSKEIWEEAVKLDRRRESRLA